jgi:hypothetical protein
MIFDLHIHSCHSHDSNLSVDDILQHAVRTGLDGIAITDHNTVAGSLLAISRAKELNLPLIVLSGVEVSTSKGHLLVLGINENIPPGLSPEETIEIAKEKGGVVIPSHPFKMTGIGNVDRLDVDAIETFNSSCIFGENAKAKKMAHALGKGEVGGSDSHLLETIGFGVTEINSEPDEFSILNALRDGKTRSSGKITPNDIMFLRVIMGIRRRSQAFGRELHRIHSNLFL